MVDAGFALILLNLSFLRCSYKSIDYLLCDMIEQFKALKRRFHEIAQQLSDPEVGAHTKAYAALSKEYKKLGQKVEVYDNYQKIVEEIDDLKALISTEEEAEMILESIKKMK